MIAMFAAAVTVALTWWNIQAHYSPVPFWDSWDGYLAYILDFSDAAPDRRPGMLLDQHNEHRIVLNRLLFLADFHFFEASAVLLFVFAALIPLLPLWVFYRILRREAPDHGTILLALSTCTLYSMMQRENFLQAFQAQFFLAQYIPLAGYYLLVRGEQAGIAVRAALVLGGALISAGTMANGLFFALPLVLVYGVQRATRPTALLALGAFALMCLLYFQVLDYRSGPGSMTEIIFNRTGRYLLYILYYAGAPFGRAPAAGAVLVVLALTALVIEARRPATGRPARALVLFLVYYGITAAVTAAGRADQGYDQALTTRYLTPTLLAWTALLLWWAIALPRIVAHGAGQARAPFVSAGFAGLALTGCIGLADWQVDKARIDRNPMARQSLGMLSLELGLQDDSMIESAIYPNGNRTRLLYTRARAATDPVFAGTGWVALAGRIGTPSKGAVRTATVPATSCDGAIEQITALGATGVVIAGWMVDGPDPGGAPPLLLSLSGEVAGVGYTGLYRHGAAGRGKPDRAWSGFRLYVPGGRLPPGAVVMRATEPGCQLTIDRPVRRSIGIAPMDAQILAGRAALLRAMDPAGTRAVTGNNGFTGSDVDRSALPGFDVLGSVRTGDADRGMLTLTLAPGQGLLYRSGPRVTGQILTVSQDGKVLASESVLSEGWGLIDVAGVPGIDPAAPVGIRLSDEGDGWGEWSAVALLQQDIAIVATGPAALDPAGWQRLAGTGAIASNDGFSGGDFTGTARPDLQVLGSHRDSDADLGTITLDLAPGQQVLYRSGPRVDGQILTVLQNGEVLAEQRTLSTDWSLLDLSGAPDLDPAAPLVLRLEDRGTGWGEWSALALRRR
ncbi:MAG: hypothetical protein AAF501_01870 [Pseudomonadota bacterium]